MKYLSKLFLLATIAVTLFTACDKVGSLPYYQAGTSTTLTASSTTIAAVPADSNKTAVTFSWTYPNFSVDSTTAKYIVEIDSTGRNFSKSVSKTVIGALSTSYTAKELNGILLGFGFTIGTAYDVDVRITASYGNNNDQIKSNTLKVKMTPYKVPPKIVLPTTGKLFIVGNATAGGDATGWNNPVPTPSQEFARIDETTFAGVFYLNGGKEYLLLPENGNWSNKYNVSDKTVPGLSAGGNFGYNLGNDNIPGPATTGWYKLVVDFQTGKFTLTSFPFALPSNLFIVGNATPGGDATGWSNPVPVPSQQFTRLNSCQFTLTLNGVNGGKEYLLLPVNGDWTNKFNVADKSFPGLNAGGTFGYNLGNDNFPGPTVSGNYKFDVDFSTLKFKTTKL